MPCYPQHTLPDFDTLPNSANVRLPTVLALNGCSRSTLYAWIEQGRFPKPVRIGPRMVAWNVGEVRLFLAGRAGTPVDPNIIAATQARMTKHKAKKITETEKARRRALLLGEV